MASEAPSGSKNLMGPLCCCGGGDGSWWPAEQRINKPHRLRKVSHCALVLTVRAISLLFFFFIFISAMRLAIFPRLPCAWRYFHGSPSE